MVGLFLFIIFLIIILFPEILALLVLLCLGFFEFILRLFGKSFDDKPKY